MARDPRSAVPPRNGRPPRTTEGLHDRRRLAARRPTGLLPRTDGPTAPRPRPGASDLAQLLWPIRGRPFWRRSYRSVNTFATSDSCLRLSTVPSDRGPWVAYVLTDRYRRAAASSCKGLRIDGETGGDPAADSAISVNPVVQAH